MLPKKGKIKKTVFKGPNLAKSQFISFFNFNFFGERLVTEVYLLFWNWLKILYFSISNMTYFKKKIYLKEGSFFKFLDIGPQIRKKPLEIKNNLFIHNYLCVLGESTTPHPSFPPDLCLYVNLEAKGAQAF